MGPVKNLQIHASNLVLVQWDSFFPVLMEN